MSYLSMVPASSWSLLVFEGICIVVVFAFLIAASLPTQERNAKRRFLFWNAIVVGYGCILGVTVLSGVLEKKFLPWGPLFMGVTVVVPIVLGSSKKGRRMMEHLSIPTLVGFQSFRLPLEIVLHSWYRSGTIPKSMTWEGSNWDVLTGVLAICCLPFVGRRLWLAWAFNVIGILLLLNVVRVAVMSSPVPFGWNVEPPLELIVQLPYAFIVPVCVGGAFLGHVLLTRKLWKLGLQR
jgi:hypothetical protein